MRKTLIKQLSTLPTDRRCPTTRQLVEAWLDETSSEGGGGASASAWPPAPSSAPPSPGCARRSCPPPTSRTTCAAPSPRRCWRSWPPRDGWSAADRWGRGPPARTPGSRWHRDGEPWDEAEARAELVRRTSRPSGRRPRPTSCGGPAGPRASRARRWPGSTWRRRVGWVLAGDTEPDPTAEPVAALLPALDPTPMGWKQREWFLPGDRTALYDTLGNVGPTLWWGGEVVGGWAVRKDGIGRDRDPGRPRSVPAPRPSTPRPPPSTLVWRGQPSRRRSRPRWRSSSGPPDAVGGRLRRLDGPGTRWPRPGHGTRSRRPPAGSARDRRRRRRRRSTRESSMSACTAASVARDASPDPSTSDGVATRTSVRLSGRTRSAGGAHHAHLRVLGRRCLEQGRAQRVDVERQRTIEVVDRDERHPCCSRVDRDTRHAQTTWCSQRTGAPSPAYRNVSSSSSHGLPSSAVDLGLERGLARRPTSPPRP